MPTPIELFDAEIELSDQELVARRMEFEKLRAERLRAGDYEGYLLMFDGHKAFPALLEIEDLLPDKDYWKCVADVWYRTDFSFPERGEWLRLFVSQRPHRELLMSKTERKRLAAMPGTLTIYRGYEKGRARSGLAWTLSEKRARIHAESEANRARRALFYGIATGGVPMIVCGKCHKRDVLAYFNGRKEQEIVIDGRKVFAKRDTTL